MSCINRNHPNFIAIKKKLDNAIAADMLINDWQKETNNENIIPEIEEFNKWYNNEETSESKVFLEDSINFIGNEIIEKNIRNNIPKIIISNQKLVINSISAAAFYDGNNHTITINKDYKYTSVLAHELIHSVTMKALIENDKFKKEVVNLMKQIKERDLILFESTYGLNNEHEFISEAFSNPIFMNALDNIKLNKKISIFKAFINLLSQFFNNDYTKTFYSTSLFKELEKIIAKYIPNNIEQRKEVEKQPIQDNQLHELMQQFCDNLGINVNMIDAVDRNGEPLEYNAVASFVQSNMKATIDLVKGKLGYDTFSEETVHFIVWMMRGTPLYKSMFYDIVKQPIYEQVKLEYKDVYKSEVQFREEAITQLINKTLISQFKDGTKLTKEQYQTVTDDINRVGRWWNKVIDYLKNLFTKVEANQYDLAAMKLLFGDTNDLSLKNIKTDATNFQLDKNKSIQEQIDETANFIENGKINIDDNHKYTQGEHEFKESVTEFIAKDDQYPDRSAKEKLKDNFLAEFGTNAHDDFKNSFKRQLENMSGEIKTAKVIYTDEKTREKINNYVTNVINSYPKGTRFIIEQPIGDLNKDRAGTPDIIVIYNENGKLKIDILDYKFSEFANNNGKVIVDELANYKKVKYTKQLKEYKRILQDAYGVNVPINGYLLPMAVTVDYNKDTKKYSYSDVEMGRIKYNNEDGKLYLNRIPLESNRTSDKTVNSILDGLIATRDRIRKKKVIGEKEENHKQNRIKDITEAIKKIILTKQLDSFFDESLLEINDLLNDVNQKNVTEVGELLTFYKNLNFSEYRTRVEMNPQLEAKINSFKNKIDDLENAYSQELEKSAEKITETLGVDDINLPQKDISWWSKTLSYLSTIDNPYIQALYKLVIKAKQSAMVEYHTQLEKISTLSKGVLEYAKSNGIVDNKAFEIFIKRDKYNNIILLDIFSETARNQIQKAREDKDYTFLKKHLIFNEEKYNQKVEHDKAFYTEKFKNKSDGDRLIQERLDLLEKQYDVRKSEYALLNKNNPYIKLNDKTLELNEDYKKIQNNPALKAFYDFFVETVQNSRKELGLSYDAKFIPQIVQSMFEAISEDNYNFKDKFWNSVSTSQQGSYGELNSLTGNPEYKIAIPYQSKIGKEASTDLGKVLALWVKSSSDAKHLGEIEDSVKLLKQALEQQKFFRTSALGKTILNKETGETEVIDAKNTKTLAAFIGFMNEALYNINITDDVAIKKMRTRKVFNEDGTPKLDANGKQVTEEYETHVSLAKFIQKVLSYLSAKSLGLNMISASANLGGGYINGLYEGEKGIQYSKKQFVNASKIFTAGKLGNTKVMTALRYFDIMGDMEGFNKANALSVNAMDKFFTYDKIYTLQKGGDTLIHNTVLISLMQSHGLDINGKIKNLRLLPEGTKSILNSMELDGDNLVIKGLTDNLDTTEFYNFRRKSLAVSQKILGASPMYDIRIANQSILGRMLMQFRGWMPRMVEERFGKLRHNNNLEDFEKGKFISFVQFLNKNIAKNSFELLKQFSGIGGNLDEILKNKWELLDDETKQKYLKNSENEAEAILKYIALEKGNIKATLLELKMLLGVLGLILLMNGGDDDDDKTAFEKVVNRSIDRMYNELSFFLVPTSVNTIINKPIPLVSLLTDITSFTEDFIGNTIGVAVNSKEMQKKNKPIKYFGKLFPVGNEIIKDLGIMFGDNYFDDYTVKKKK